MLRCRKLCLAKRAFQLIDVYRLICTDTHKKNKQTHTKQKKDASNYISIIDNQFSYFYSWKFAFFWKFLFRLLYLRNTKLPPCLSRRSILSSPNLKSASVDYSAYVTLIESTFLLIPHLFFCVFHKIAVLRISMF